MLKKSINLIVWKRWKNVLKYLIEPGANPAGGCHVIWIEPGQKPNESKHSGQVVVKAGFGGKFDILAKM